MSNELGSRKDRSRRTLAADVGHRFLRKRETTLPPSPSSLERFNDSFHHDGNPRSRRSISKRFPRLFIVTRGSPRARLPTMASIAKRLFHPSRFKNLSFSGTEGETSIYRKCYGILLHDFKRSVSLFENSTLITRSSCWKIFLIEKFNYSIPLGSFFLFFKL